MRQYGCGPVTFTGAGQRALRAAPPLRPHATALRPQAPANDSRPSPAPCATCSRSAGCTPRTPTTQENPKRVYYLSMEFLIGRSLANNVTNLLLDPLAEQAVKRKQSRLARPARAGTRRRAGQRRPRPAGGLLPRLAGHHATPGDGLWAALRVRHLPPDDHKTASRSNSPTTGCAQPDPWEVARPRETVEVRSTAPSRLRKRRPPRDPRHSPSHLLGMPYDRPVVGYGGQTINTLRLWAAACARLLRLRRIQYRRLRRRRRRPRCSRETVTRVLYPDDSTSAGQGLRFVQEYFLVGLLAGRHRRRASAATNGDWTDAARQGRHPAQRHAPRDGRARVDAHPAGRGQARLGRGLGPHRPHAGLHEPHAAARGAGEVAGPLVRAGAARGTWRSSTRSTAASSTTCGSASPATRAACGA